MGDMKDIIIREACINDAAQIIAYLKRLGSETDNLTFGEEGLPITVEEEEKYIQEVLNSEHSAMYVALENGEIVGDGSLSAMPRRMAHRAELGVGVVKDKWNCGIGSTIIKKLIEYAKSHGIEIINLEVRADNQNAIYIYEKFGFKQIGVSPAFFKVGNEYIDFVLMYLDSR